VGEEFEKGTTSRRKKKGEVKGGERKFRPLFCPVEESRHEIGNILDKGGERLRKFKWNLRERERNRGVKGCKKKGRAPHVVGARGTVPGTIY